MRRFLNVALENHFEGAPVLGDENISMEEEAIMLDESSQAAAETAQDLSEAERIVEVSDALEDLAVVAGSKDELTPQEAQLLETAGDMAVAGTDVDPDEIVPSMESFKDANGKILGSIVMESFREKAKSLWEAILRILKDIWNKIEAFFYKIFGTIPRRRKQLAALKDKAEHASGLQRKEAKFSVAVNRYMVTGGAPIKTVEGYQKALGDVVKTAEWVYGPYVDSLGKKGDKIASALEDFNVDNPAESTDKLRAELPATAHAPGAVSHRSSRWEKFSVMKGHDLLGGVSLFSLSLEGKGGENTLAVLERERQAQVHLSESQDKSKDNSSSIDFPTITPVQCESLIKDLEELFEAMEKYQRGKAKGEIEKTRKKIEAASKKAEGASSKAKESEEAAERAAVPHYRALINFNIAYARWIESPIMGFTKLGFGVANTTISLIERSLAQYK
jgi:hypothetical protein